jgi:hypothetical protein
MSDNMRFLEMLIQDSSANWLLALVIIGHLPQIFQLV